MPGNVQLTITAPWETGRGGGATIALATGLAICRAIAGIVGNSGVVSIKWPNDVLVDGRKISGTLIEADSSAICVGIGINVAASPDLKGYPVTCLSEFSSEPKQDVIEKLLSSWTSTYQAWHSGGFGEIQPEYNRRLHFLDQAMRLSLDREKQAWISGVCRGTDEHGCLVIEGANGVRNSYSVGDVDRPEAGPNDV